MNLSRTPRQRGKRKPLVGLGSILLAFILAYAGYLATESILAAGALAGIPTYVAPAYFAWKREPLKAYASAILASMVSGSIAWIVTGLGGRDAVPPVDPVLAFALGLATAGLASHLAASTVFVYLLDAIDHATTYYPSIASLFLCTSSATVLGLVIVVSLRKPRDIFSPSVLLVAVLGILFLLLTAEAWGV
ncbi:MAG: hypothetical protein GSR73_00625 [Desulfurococcales archaeon]|nr:hypothetical protein [Desulfurococcales archaeon]